MSKDPLDITGAEKDRLTGIDARINEEAKNQKAAYEALLVELRSYQQLNWTLNMLLRKREQFNEMVNISKNTLRTADNTELLVDIAAGHLLF